MDLIPSRKGIRIPKGNRKRICRSTGRSTDPCHGRSRRSTGSNREQPAFSRSTGPVDLSLPRSTGRATVMILCTFVHAGRPGGRPASSTGRLGGRQGAQSGLLNVPFLAPLIFDLCANFLYSSISSLSTILHLDENFSNLSRSPTNSNLSPGEIDT